MLIVCFEMIYVLACIACMFALIVRLLVVYMC